MGRRATQQLDPVDVYQAFLYKRYQDHADLPFHGRVSPGHLYSIKQLYDLERPWWSDFGFEQREDAVFLMAHDNHRLRSLKIFGVTDG